MKKADYVFETSWEICNKVGGIYTVLSTKALTAVNHFHNNYICIGPDISHESGGNCDFEESQELYRSWRETAVRSGLRIRVGRWRVAGSPIVVLVDFTPFFEKKNEILTDFWLNYKLDSISGQWDYVEPLLFGYAAGKVIESFYQYHCSAMDHIVAHFHEWMTGGGILYLKSACPQVATVFTTHATVLGRCIAGNGLPLYGDLQQYDPQGTANRFGVQSKFSLESLSASHADAYSTVSEITDQECAAFFEKPADVITINGFENDFVPKGEEYVQKRAAARAKLLQVASCLLQQPISNDALLLLNSGRYEFHNKGIDLFVRTMAELEEQHPQREIVAFIMVPAGTSGLRTELIKRMEEHASIDDDSHAALRDYSTHPLHDPYNDPIIKELNRLNVDNAPASKVKVIFVPVYLDGRDGVFNLSYYDTLIGFDMTLFPSYYEPWGYTPLESVAFGIPTVTTSLAGFGAWVKTNFTQQQGVTVCHRTDTNEEEVCRQMVDAVLHFSILDAKTKEQASADARAIAAKALWSNLYENYENVYDKALENSALRYEFYKDKMSHFAINTEPEQNEQPKWKRVTIKSNLPDNLVKLEALANNLWWSWNYEARELFEEIAGPECWAEYNQNPVHMLQMLPLDVLQKFSRNVQFVQKLDRVYADFQNYMNEPCSRSEKKVAYFSMEFGISNELKIYSGGLGMLAGDYLKEASDCNVNMVAVGLLYRCGYFVQQISPNGEQINLYPQQSFSKLPIHPVRDAEGNWVTVTMALPGRQLYARIWRVDVGRIKLYLLDTDLDKNNPDDRKITANLYGGDWENRLKQEFLLGIGGVRLLDAVGEKPEIFHLNEGHASFLSLERTRMLMEREHLSFPEAMELVKASSLFTTHTPVPAGHDAFSEDMMRVYFSRFPDLFNISWQQFMGLGRKRASNAEEKFSMSILACRFCQEVNGVSCIHGRVTRDMFEYLYDGRFSDELHIGYVTNGVHYPTWAHKRWQQFHQQLLAKDFKKDISNEELWSKIYEASDKEIWNLKEELRKELIKSVKELVESQMRRRNDPPALIMKTVKAIRDDVLTVGFARRFATYKRAHLLFTNEERLHALLNNPQHPMQFIFAGKAHPHDKAGQDLIRRIIDFSRRPEYIGKIIFVENYDMVLAKKLISGCDVWLNTPTRPLEASGTSGEKAVMNGVLNFSVLDGWWAEGYVQGAGWAVDEQITYADVHRQDELDAANIYAIFEEQIAPAFYCRTEGIPLEWTGMMKNCFAKISPHFTMKRQLDDYYQQFYSKLQQRSEMLTADGGEKLKELVQWKNRVLSAWGNVRFLQNNLPSDPDSTFYLGFTREIYAEVELGTLHPDEVKLEIVFTRSKEGRMRLFSKYAFKLDSYQNGVARFVCPLDAKVAGVWNWALRLIPQHPLLPHDMDLSLVKWG